MKNLLELKHLFVSKKVRSFPPLDEGKGVSSLVYLNTMSTETNISIMSDKNLFYLRNGMLFLDYMYNGKIHNVTYRENIRKLRVDYYRTIKEVTNNFIRPTESVSDIDNKNLYFDMHKYNQIFFRCTDKVHFKKRVEMYLEHIKSIMSSPNPEKFTHKFMFLDARESSQFVNINSGIKNFNNPLFMIYYAMHKQFDNFKGLGDVNLIFILDNESIMRVNPNECDANTYSKFKERIKSVTRNSVIPATDSEVEKAIALDIISSNVLERYNLTGDEDDDSTQEDIIKTKVEEMIEEELDETKEVDDSKDIEDVEGLEDKIKDKMENDKVLLEEIRKTLQDRNTGRSTASIKRDEELKKRQSEITINGTKIVDIGNRQIPKLEKNEVSDKIESTNENIHNVKFPSFEEVYNKEVYEKDILNTFLTLSENEDLPMYIIDVKVEDTSDSLNFKDTYTIKLEDANRKRHTIKVDMPKFVDNKFMYLNGNKKIFIKQLLLKPIVKTKRDEVQIVSSYNKIFVMRAGKKISKAVQQIKKLLSGEDIKGITIKRGNASNINHDYITVLEYDSLAEEYITLETKDHRFIFDQGMLYKELSTPNKDYVLPEKSSMVVGYNKKDKSPILLDKDQLILGTDKEFMDFVIESMEATQPGLAKSIRDLSAGKAFTYSRVKIMHNYVPLLLLLSFYDGLTTVLRKAEIAHYFTDKNPSAIISSRQDYIRFADGYLVYNKYPLKNSLLLNGLSVIDTKLFNYEEFDSRDIYGVLFDQLYGTARIGSMYLNYYHSMIDSVTKEVLEDLNYPTRLVELLIYANSLLSDSHYLPETNMNLYRVRSNEMVSSILYKQIITQYNFYRNASLTDKNATFSIKQDAVLKQVLSQQVLEDYSVLNPIVEAEKGNSVTPKGPSGLNVSRAYTEEKRSYDKTMLGLMAMSSSPDANIGVVRTLAMEPNIKNARGYINLRNDDVDNLTDAEIFSVGEALTPIGASRDRIIVSYISNDILKTLLIVWELL